MPMDGVLAAIYRKLILKEKLSGRIFAPLR
jgi:hypothetical protein